VGEESHNTITFHHHVEAPFRNKSAPKCGEFVDLTDINTPAKYGFKILIGFSRPRYGKHFLC